MKLRVVAAIETVTPQMLEKTWREIEYRLDILRGTKGALVEVIWHSAVLILKVMKHFELHFHIPYAVLLCFSGLKIISHGNTDNNVESLCIMEIPNVISPHDLL
jgi:hypothetical protein